MSWGGNRRRNVRQTVTFTPDEWDRASELYGLVKGPRGYRSFGAFAREMLMTGAVHTVRVATEPSQIRPDINRIGQNVNQFARVANTSKTVTPDQMEAMTAELRKLNEVFARLVQEYADMTAGGW